MTEPATDRRRRRFLALFLAAITAPRFLIPLVASTALTASVAGPLAFKAFEARRADPLPAEVSEGDDAAPAPADAVVEDASTTTTTTTTTTTSTTTTTTTPSTTTAPTTSAPTVTAVPTTTPATSPSTTTTTTTTTVPEPRIGVSILGPVDAGRPSVVAVRETNGIGTEFFSLAIEGAVLDEVLTDGWSCGADGVCRGPATASVHVAVAVDPGAGEVRASVGDEVAVATASAAPLTARYAVHGAVQVTTVGNGQMTCPDGATVADGSSCEDARARSASTGAAGATNNAFDMTWIAADGRAAQPGRNSTSATLDRGGDILWAGLYWGGSATTPTQAVHGDVLVAFSPSGASAPTDGGYASIVAEDFWTTDQGYQAFADVTALASAGDVWVADMVAETGANGFAGWALVVVRASGAADSREVLVLDGLAGIGAAAATEVGAALTTPVDRVTVVAYEGEWQLGPDSVRVDLDVHADAANPAGDHFNSSITLEGLSIDARQPAYANTFGFDLDTFSVPGRTTDRASVRFEAAGDRFGVGVVVLEAS